jgi:cyclophilin family peptidyl-prolyl cis-trans isomerase
MLDYQGPEKYGYAVFGRVSAGMDVVDAIRAVPTGSAGMHSDVPTTPVVIQKAAILTE